MKLTLPNKAYSPELKGKILFYYDKPLDYGDLTQRPKSVELPEWFAEYLTQKIAEQAVRAKYQAIDDTKAAIRHAIGL